MIRFVPGSGWAWHGPALGPGSGTGRGLALAWAALPTDSATAAAALATAVRAVHASYSTKLNKSTNCGMRRATFIPDSATVAAQHDNIYVYTIPSRFCFDDTPTLFPDLTTCAVLTSSSMMALTTGQCKHRNTLETPKYTEIHYSACTYPPKYTHN